MTTKVALATDEWQPLAERARLGEEAAWRTIVDHLSGVVWKVLMSYDLSPADRDDAYASTFFRLFEKLESVHDCSRLPGWVASAARNEANAVWRKRKRLVPSDELHVQLQLREIPSAEIDEGLLDSELLASVMHAFGKLPAEGQALLRLLTAVPPLSYDEISALLGIPKGSIGPTAGRLLARLRRLVCVPDQHGGVA
jgi:RNA polymerase sigma factor (sigma-70 family)